jgi:hypothetical protein
MAFSGVLCERKLAIVWADARINRFAFFQWTDAERGGTGIARENSIRG